MLGVGKWKWLPSHSTTGPPANAGKTSVGSVIIISTGQYNLTKHFFKLRFKTLESKVYCEDWNINSHIILLLHLNIFDKIIKQCKTFLVAVLVGNLKQWKKTEFLFTVHFLCSSTSSFICLYLFCFKRHWWVFCRPNACLMHKIINLL